jgi:hypothetical protein
MASLRIHVPSNATESGHLHMAYCLIIPRGTTTIVNFYCEPLVIPEGLTGQRIMHLDCIYEKRKLMRYASASWMVASHGSIEILINKSLNCVINHMAEG